VDAVLRIGKEIGDLVDAVLAGVRTLQRDPRGEAEIEDRKEERAQKRVVALVKRAVDKYVEVELRLGPAVYARVPGPQWRSLGG
jgi:hypothetical protein